MLIVNFLPLVLAISASRATSLPPEDDSDFRYASSPVEVAEIRQKRSAFPGRAMMFHGYFGNQGHHPYHNPVTSHHGYDSHNNRPYDPQGSMTAFAAGNTVSSESSYYGGGGGCRNCDRVKKPANGNGNGPSNGNGHPTNGKGPHQQDVPSDIPATNKKPVNGNGNGPSNGNGQEHKPVWNQDVGYPNGNGNGDYQGDQPAAEETPKGETLPSESPTIPVDPEGTKKGPEVDDSEEDEEEDEPSFFSHGKGRGKGRGPNYNSYFPMVFGFYPGFGGGRHGNREDGKAYNPGTATAIANSFSTGRGAVASSHATAYGGPHFVPSGYRRNGSRGLPH